VQRLLASCTGDTPTEIRDRAMLLLATYGLRSVEVRALRVDDIDWERETKRFTRHELSYLDKPEMDALLATPIAARIKADAIMRSYCSSITLALASPRLPLFRQEI
jgi:integrase/recombinase XerD